MRIFLRSLEIIIVLINIIIFILFAIGLIITRPSKLKPIIAKQVHTMTGRQIHFGGKLHWSFSPIGIEASNVTFSNPKGFSEKNMASIAHFNFHVRFWPLLVGKISATEVTADDLKIHLIQLKDGRNNWTMNKNVGRCLTPACKPETTTKTKQKNSKDESTGWGFSTPKIAFKNMNIIWDDYQNKQHMAINNLNITASNIKNKQAFPMQASLNLKNAIPNKIIKIKLNGKVSFSANQLQLKPFTLRVDDSTTQGFIAIKNFNKPNVNFSLNTNQLNLDQYLLADKDKNKKPAAKKSTTPSKPKAIKPNPKDYQAMNKWLRKLTLNGKLHLKKLTVFKATMQNIKTNVNGKNSMINIGPATATLYKGAYQGHYQLNVKKAMPQITVYEDIQHVQMKPLLHDMFNYDKLTGTAHLTGDITAQSFDKNYLIATSHGKLNASILNGALQGVDIAHYGRTLVALINKQKRPKQSGGNFTDFGSLTASGPIKNGILQLTTLSLRSPVLNVNGKGQANLLTQTLDLTLDATLVKGSTKQTQAIAPALPINVTGTFTDPEFDPDYQGALQNVAKHLLDKHRDKIENKVRDTLKDKLKDKLTFLSS